MRTTNAAMYGRNCGTDIAAGFFGDSRSFTKRENPRNLSILRLELFSGGLNCSFSCSVNIVDVKTKYLKWKQCAAYKSVVFILPFFKHAVMCWSSTGTVPLYGSFPRSVNTVANRIVLCRSLAIQRTPKRRGCCFIRLRKGVAKVKTLLQNFVCEPLVTIIQGLFSNIRSSLVTRRGLPIQFFSTVQVDSRNSWPWVSFFLRFLG